MGGRHLIFVIARVNGYYRSLSTIDHTTSEARTALESCLDNIRVFSDAVNYLPIQQELAAAATKDNNFWDVSQDQVNSFYIHNDSEDCLL